jgi:hypothetical protein
MKPVCEIPRYLTLEQLHNEATYGELLKLTV